MRAAQAGQVRPMEVSMHHRPDANRSFGRSFGIAFRSRPRMEPRKNCLPPSPSDVRGFSMAEDTGSRQSFAALAGQIGELHERAVAEYSLVVEDILRTGSRDPRRIERTLDGLLNF